MRARLLHTGNLVIDLVMTVPALPELGGDVLATSAETTPGGGFNVMAAAARQGLPVIYAGAHGTGSFGDQARAALRVEGITALTEPRPAPDTGFVISLVDASGERTFVTSPGAEATLTSKDLAELRPDPHDIVYVSGYGLLYAPNRAALTDWLPAVDPETTVVVDPGPLIQQIPQPALELLLHRADWWSCNAREATQLTGLSEPSAAARALRSRLGRGSVLLRTGPGGCLLDDGDADEGSARNPRLQGRRHRPQRRRRRAHRRIHGRARRRPQAGNRCSPRQRRRRTRRHRTQDPPAPRTPLRWNTSSPPQQADPRQRSRDMNSDAIHSILAATARGPASAPDAPTLERFLASATQADLVSGIAA